MNDDKKIDNKIIETLLLIVIMSLVAVFSIYYIPYILVLFPVPFIVFGIKNGIVPNMINMVITCIIVGIIDSPGYGLFLLILFLPIAFTISYFIKNRRSNLEILGISAIVFFASILLVLALTNILGIDFVGQIEEGFRQILEVQLEQLENMDLTSYQFLEGQEALRHSYRLSLLIFPSVLLVLSLLISYFNYSLASFGLNKLRIKIVNTPRFARFRLPNNIIVGTLVMFLSVFIMDRLKFEYSEAIIINLVSLIGFMLLLQGLAVVEYFLKKFRVSSIVRFIIYFMIIFNNNITVILTIVGLIDVVIDFRKIKTSKSL